MSLLRSIENRAAIRTAISAVIAIMISFALHLDKPYWAGMTVVVLANFYVGNIIDKAFLRIVGTIVGVWIGFILVKMIANSFFLYLVINFFLIAIATYYYNFSYYAYSFLLGSIGAFYVIAQIAIDPGQAFYIAIWRSIEISIGVLVSAAAAFCIFPNNLSSSINSDVLNILESFQNFFQSLENTLIKGDPAFIFLAKANLNLKKKLKKSTDLLGFMRHEMTISREEIDVYRFFLEECYELTRTFTYFISLMEREAKLPDLNTKLLNSIFKAISNDLSLIRKLYFKEPSADLNPQINKVVHFNTENLSPSPIYQDLKSLITKTGVHFNNLIEILIEKKPLIKNKQKTISSKQQLMTDSDVLKHGIKAGLAAILALVFWLISNWPGGINGIISSVVISVRKNLYEMRDVSLHRFLGCFIGGTVALFPLQFFSLNLYALVLIIFVCVWVFSYFSFKIVKYSYVWLQANMALIIALAQAGGPPTEIAAPLQRLGGIVIGILASFLVGNLIWRAHPLILLSNNISKLYHYLIYNMEAFFFHKKVPYDLTNRFWLTRGLLDTLSQENLIDKKKKNLELLRQQFKQGIRLQAAVSYLMNNFDKNAINNLATQLHINLFEIESSIIRLLSGKESIVKASQDEIFKKIQAQQKLIQEKDTPGSNLLKDYLRTLEQLTELSLNA